MSMRSDKRMATWYEKRKQEHEAIIRKLVQSEIIAAEQKRLEELNAIPEDEITAVQIGEALYLLNKQLEEVNRELNQKKEKAVGMISKTLEFTNTLSERAHELKKNIESNESA